jgi:Flp pilus assembly protein TadB
MEFLLLWVDELDDAIGALRHLLPQILGFLVATALFIATGVAMLVAPQVTLLVAALVFCASALEVARRRRIRMQARREN